MKRPERAGGSRRNWRPLLGGAAGLAVGLLAGLPILNIALVHANWSTAALLGDFHAILGAALVWVVLWIAAGACGAAIGVFVVRWRGRRA